MRKHIPDPLIFAVIFIILTDFSKSTYAYEMGFARILVPVLSAVAGSMWYILRRREPVSRSWTGILDAAADIVILFVVFTALFMLHLWGFVGTEIFPVCNEPSFNFMTTSWMIYFAASLFMRLVIIIEKLFHWWDKRKIKIKEIE